MSTRHRSAFLRMLVMVATAVAAMWAGTSQAAEFLQLPDGSRLDLSQKCPVCEMEIGGKDQQGVTLTFKDGRVAGFHGVAAAVFKDGRVVGFDGARCMFVYNSIPQKYNVNVADIAQQYVTDFVSKKMIELPRAFLVLGSEVKGPMGYDLIAFSNKEEAAKFASENDGKWIVQLHEITRAAQTGAEKVPTAEKSQGVQADETSSTVAARPETVEPQAKPLSKERRRVPLRTREFDPYDPSVGRGSGHHGGGGMMH